MNLKRKYYFLAGLYPINFLSTGFSFFSITLTSSVFLELFYVFFFISSIASRNSELFLNVNETNGGCSISIYFNFS
jgi:hypothetical protein